MTPKVIYHNFQQNNHPAFPTETNIVLTSRVLANGRRWHKFWNNTGKAIDTACLALCGTCIAVSLALICHILLS